MEQSIAAKPRKVIRRRRRPARPQVQVGALVSEAPQTGTTYNVWFNKWAYVGPHFFRSTADQSRGGDREDARLAKTHAKGRCTPTRDSGYTRADDVPGSYICLYFARGLCHKGQDCEYLHRLPRPYDVYGPTVDCFGRDKFADYREDMGGVGTFTRQNRTIYVGHIHVTDNIEEVVARHFATFGAIDRIRVLTSRGTAFVTYASEGGAQFAKEAMACQSLDHDEVLNVRWATADPNPTAQKREERRVEEQAAEAIRRVLPAEFVADLEGTEAMRKKRRVQENYGLEGYEAPDDVWYNAVRSPKIVDQGLDDTDSGVDASPGSELREGIVSNAVLQALKDQNFAVQLRREDRPVGPLVGYGSDSDDD